MIVTSTTMTRVQPIALCGRCSCMVVVIGWTTSTMYRMVWQSHRMVIGRGLLCHRQLCWWVIMLGLRRGTCGLDGWPSGLWGGDAYGIQGLCMVSVRVHRTVRHRVQRSVTPGVISAVLYMMANTMRAVHFQIHRTCQRNDEKMAHGHAPSVQQRDDNVTATHASTPTAMHVVQRERNENVLATSVCNSKQQQCTIGATT